MLTFIRSVYDRFPAGCAFSPPPNEEGDQLSMPVTGLIRTQPPFPLSSHARTRKGYHNLSVVDLGQIDVLVEEGYYSSRTDFFADGCPAPNWKNSTKP